MMLSSNYIAVKSSIKNGFKSLLPLAFIATNTAFVTASEQSLENESLSALQEEILWLQEETFVSTATKTLESIKKSGATISVITAVDLKNMGARNLMDALKRIPGIDIQTSSIGIPTISVRGVKTESSEKVLFLINGHSINNNLVNGGATWAYGDFQVDEIKQVEIVRGPGSALYGANAFVAIINLVTKSSEDINGTKITLGAGSNQTKKLNIQTGNTAGLIKYAFNFNMLDTNGIEKQVASDGPGDSGKTLSWQERYDIGFNISSGNYNLQGKYLDRTSGPFIGIGSTLNDESKQDYKEYFFELTYSRNITEQFSITTKLYHDHFEANNFWEILSEGFGGGAFPNGVLGSPTVKNEKAGGEIQLEHSLNSGHKLLFGATFEHQTQFDVQHFTNFDPINFTPEPIFTDVSGKWNWNDSHRRDLSAIYIQDIWDISQELRLILGARRDNYSDFGHSFNPRSSLTWELTDNFVLTAVYGQAFRAPNFGELYNINNPAITGNPNLNPEEIETFELSLDSQVNKRTNIRVTTFKNNIKDIIKYVGNVSSNAGKLETTGIEIDIDSRLRNGSSFDLNYTYQYPVNKENDSRAPDIPLHQANAAYNYRHSKTLNTYLGLQYRSSLGRISTDTRSDVPSTFTVDLAVNWQDFNNNLEVKASIYNLLDKNYYDSALDNSPNFTVSSDFPTLSRSFMLEASYKL